MTLTDLGEMAGKVLSRMSEGRFWIITSFIYPNSTVQDEALGWSLLRFRAQRGVSRARKRYAARLSRPNLRGTGSVPIAPLPLLGQNPHLHLPSEPRSC